jgi:hypothetical protein
MHYQREQFHGEEDEREIRVERVLDELIYCMTMKKTAVPMIRPESYPIVSCEDKAEQSHPAHHTLY